jgi:hypothetical protein
MKFCFALNHLSIGDTVKIERLDITTEYTVDEFAAMMSAYPAIIEAVAKMATDAPASRPVVVNWAFRSSLHRKDAAMSLKLVTPGDRRPSKTKSFSLAVFSGVRTAQRVALQVPVVAQATAQEIAEAWRETGATHAKNA